MTKDDSFASRLASTRGDCQISQGELAQLAGIAAAQISRYESGKNIPRPGIIAKLAKALNVSTEWLATGNIPFNGRANETIQLKLPDYLHAHLTDAADSSARSLESEIVERLERSTLPISDEESMMAAVRTLMEYGKKYDMDVAIKMSQTSEKILELAIKNGSLPPDATLEDLKNPGPAIERWERQKKSKRTA